MCDRMLPEKVQKISGKFSEEKMAGVGALLTPWWANIKSREKKMRTRNTIYWNEKMRGN